MSSKFCWSLCEWSHVPWGVEIWPYSPRFVYCCWHSTTAYTVNCFNWLKILCAYIDLFHALANCRTARSPGLFPLLILSFLVAYTHGMSFSALSFSALTLLVRRQKEHPACKNWVMRCLCGYLSGAKCRLFAYGPADATASQNPIIICLM